MNFQGLPKHLNGHPRVSEQNLLEGDSHPPDPTPQPQGGGRREGEFHTQGPTPQEGEKEGGGFPHHTPHQGRREGDSHGFPNRLERGGAPRDHIYIYFPPFEEICWQSPRHAMKPL